ncbi:hypothetical protein PAPYR_13104 [Paratrimastix pyriformis]|uniref:Uncharacterized protein n=1 Tax=Paratrimastix pyriformis TaxID=342808 RepID=A0ABQ8U0T1_9EUKA|nr:hypothetical protein PAPYR_13104 [Paratrimastix pyriformis]
MGVDVDGKPLVPHRAADAWLGAERQEKSVLDMTLIRIVTRTQPCSGQGPLYTANKPGPRASVPHMQTSLTFHTPGIPPTRGTPDPGPGAPGASRGTLRTGSV